MSLFFWASYRYKENDSTKGATAVTQKPLQAVKRPVQARSIARFEKILDAAEQLILENGIDATSHHKIAEHAELPSASVYQYFPSQELIFQALSERHFETVKKLYKENAEKATISSWKDLAELLVLAGYEYYTTDPIGEQLFLGVHAATNVRKGAAGRLTEFAEWFLTLFEPLDGQPAVEDLQEKLAISVNLMDAAFVRSLSLYNRITPAYRDEAVRAVSGYLGTYFAK